MYINTKKTISIKSIYTFLAVIVVLLNSGYYRSTITDSYIPLFLLIITAGIGMLFHFQWKTLPKLSWFSFMLVAAILLSIFANFNKANLLSGARVAATLMCAGILTSVLSFKEFTDTFTLFIKCIVLFSIALEVLLLLGVGGMPTVGGYYDLLVVTRKVSGNRASGIFWEPGVFATMIIISMLCEYYFANKKIKLFGLIIYVCGILATRSTAGVILMLVVFFGLLWKRNENKKRHPFYSVLFIISIVAIVVFYNNIIEFLVDLNPDLFGKLVETDSGTTSTRLNSPLINLRVFSEKPLFGWGFTDSSAQILEIMPSTGGSKVVAQTSTSTQIMAAIGVLGVFYSLAFLLPIFNRKKVSHLSLELKIIVAVCMLLMVNKEPHLFIVTTWMLMFYMNQKTHRENTFESDSQ